MEPIELWPFSQGERRHGLDTGIGQDPVQLGGAAAPMMGNFVVMELARRVTWSEERGRLCHYRTDAVIETPDGRVIGVEVRARRHKPKT